MANSWILIEHATVIDGDANPPQPDTAVLIKDNRIHAVGADATRQSVPTGEPVTVIDATGKTVMPGLIDAHVHMTYGLARTQEEIDLYTSHELRTLIAAWHLKSVLRAGVTSISQPGGSYYIGVGLREAVKRGLIEGPRTISAARYLSTSNSLTDFYPDSVGVPDGSVGVLTNTMDEIKNEIRHQVKNGVDLIKMADSPDGGYQAFTDDELKFAADLTHQLNRKITIHARGPGEVSAAAAAGFDWIMHGNVIDDATIERLLETKVPLVPTLLSPANAADFGHLCGASYMRERGKWLLDVSAPSLHKAHEAGVKFITGTDSGFAHTPFGQWHARELQLLVDIVGLSPLEAIQAATKNAAVTVNLDGEVGEIAPGKLADVLIVDGDPLKDLSKLWRQRHVVIKDGKFVDTSDPVEVDRDKVRAQNHMGIAQRELTLALVYGEQDDDTPAPDAGFGWAPNDAHEIAHELAAQERSLSSHADFEHMD